MSTALVELLQQCREALTEAVPGFERSPLAHSLDASLREILRNGLPPVAAGAKTTAQQVAQAWQTVVRGLKLSEPALYDEMQEKVMSLLNAGDVPDPASELLLLEAQLHKLRAEGEPLRAKLNDMVRRAADSQRALDRIYKALAMAAPGVNGSTDPLELALQRLDVLASEHHAPTLPTAAGSGGGTVARAAPARVEIDGPVPSRSVLEAVAGGQRDFSKDQREWMVSECMTLTGWEFTPVELIEKGEAWMAQLVLDRQG